MDDLKINAAAGNRVKEMRGSRTQVEMATLAGVTQGQWSKFEKGQIPKIDVAAKIASALNTTVEYLCYGISQTKYPQFAAVQAETISKDKPMPYEVRTIVEGKRITPKEERLLEIIRSSPEAASIVEMLGAMDSDTRKDVQLGVQKEKLLRELLKEKSEREVA